MPECVDCKNKLSMFLSQKCVDCEQTDPKKSEDSFEKLCKTKITICDIYRAKKTLTSIHFRKYKKKLKSSSYIHDKCIVIDVDYSQGVYYIHAKQLGFNIYLILPNKETAYSLSKGQTVEFDANIVSLKEPEGKIGLTLKIVNLY